MSSPNRILVQTNLIQRCGQTLPSRHRCHLIRLDGNDIHLLCDESSCQLIRNVCWSLPPEHLHNRNVHIQLHVSLSTHLQHNPVHSTYSCQCAVPCLQCCDERILLLAERQ